MIPCLVTKNSHGFSFVFWATIGLARKNFPNVNQFFESLYISKNYFKFENWGTLGTPEFLKFNWFLLM